MAIDYRYNADNLIEQQDDDGSYTVHTLTDGGSFGNEKTLFDNQVARWRALAVDNELRTGVPAANTQAIIFSESGGDPNAHGPPSDYGIGLMMITSNGLKEGLSNDQVFVPENNVKLGTDFLQTLAEKIGNYDIVQLASMFNCGPGSNGPKLNPSAPWGFCEYQIPSTGAYPYISKVVRAYNYATQTGGSTSSVGSKIGLAALGVAVVGAAGLAGIYFADPGALSNLRHAVFG